MIEVTIIPIPAQQLSVTLSEQQCEIRIYQHSTGIYIDMAADGKAIFHGVLALNANPLVRYKYLGFVGDLIFVDTKGDNDPEYTGLGDRYKLYYLSEDEL